MSDEEETSVALV